MKILNFRINLLLLLVMMCAVFSSCKFDDDEKMYSSRSYNETYALLRPYIMVNESDEFELDAVYKEIADSLSINPGHISKLQGDLYVINQQIKKALNDSSCAQVLMITERQGALIKKTTPNLEYEISSKDVSILATRANTSMNIDPNQERNAIFTGGPQVRTDINVSPGWASLYVLNFTCRTGKLNNGRDYIFWTGTAGSTFTNYWYANSPNGNNTQWNFNVHGLSNGATGYVSFQW